MSEQQSTTPLFDRPKPSERIAGIHYDATPQAQAYRRRRLEPDAILAHLRDWKGRGDAQWAALSLIEMTGYMQLQAAERIAIIDRITDALDEVLHEPDATPAEPDPEIWVVTVPLGAS